MYSIDFLNYEVMSKKKCMLKINQNFLIFITHHMLKYIIRRVSDVLGCRVLVKRVHLHNFAKNIFEKKTNK